ncbi:probable 6-phosphogluconolactonase 1 [Hibiscus syriacus]|uniref:probable 6-phosphogluconolactonase 1 n=1 Tax=Hibiscus syriacus TaxID=106335 RepID=UPI0019214775|nr:probable 6-phosphogluconolactonase 1 [Hibiscus syriacus]
MEAAGGGVLRDSRGLGCWGSAGKLGIALSCTPSYGRSSMDSCSYSTELANQREEANKVADFLAHYGHSMPLVRVLLQHPPASVGRLLQCDIKHGNPPVAAAKIDGFIAELRTELADYIAELSEAAVKERGVFAIALSGGSLIDLMGKLCEAPYDKTVDWAKWYIFWADERVVAKTHSDSNYKLAKDGLLSKVPIVPSHVHSINDSVSAEEAADDYMFVVRQLVKTRMVSVSDISDCPKFDLILLGMGPDGHIASLFPNHSALDETDEWVTFIIDSPKPPPERITFTLPVINSASNVAMVVTGESKAEAVHLAIDNIGHDRPLLPARLVQPTKGKLVWFLDKLAASELDGLQFSEFNSPDMEDQNVSISIFA